MRVRQATKQISGGQPSGKITSKETQKRNYYGFYIDRENEVLSTENPSPPDIQNKSIKALCPISLEKKLKE